MKILICIPCLMTGGTEIQTLNLVNALVRGGHKVTTVCYFEHSEQMIDNYKLAGSDVICLSAEGNRIGGWRGIKFLFDGLKKVVKELKPDVAHVQYMTPGAIPIFILKLLGVKNVIATAHTAADIYPNLRLIHFVQKYCVNAFTCITRNAEESFFGTSQLYNAQMKLGKINHFTIYNALPSYISIIKEAKAFLNDEITIGVVSRLEKIKGMDLVIPAFAKVKEKYENINLLIVGDGSQRELMESQVEEMQLSDCVEFAGRQPQNALQDYYDKIDILLMPSRSEGFGLTAIEGMARGCVLVASNIGGLSEVVKDREVGLLHETENVNDIADKVLSLLKNGNQIEDFSYSAINYVRKFSFENYSQSFNGLYKRLF